jgi:hypothetical protein
MNSRENHEYLRLNGLTLARFLMTFAQKNSHLFLLAKPWKLKRFTLAKLFTALA